MDEFPTYTGAEGEPTTLFYLGRDRVVYQWTLGAQAVPISMPIQNVLDSTLTSLTIYQQSRLHCVSAWGRRFVVLYPYAAQSVFYLYDIDHQLWSSTTPIDGTFFDPVPMGGSIAFATIYGLNPPVNEVFGFRNSVTGATVRSWVRDDATFSSTPFTMRTFPMNFDGKKTRKQIVAANLHATAGTWTLAVTTNESGTLTTSAAAFSAYPDPLDSIYGATPFPADGAGSQDSVVMAGQFYSDGTPVVGYRFEFNISRTDSMPGKIYALDIAYVDMEPQGEGDA
jgi:hypothetical protein